MEFLTESKILAIIQHTPLIAIDLIIKNKNGEVLLGLRKNQPAKDFWFTPGGRIRKNELITQAFSRIIYDELGIIAQIDIANFIRVFEHL